MKYETIALELLHRLGIQKTYKGCEYIISCIKYISENETAFTPVTKVLYIEIAKQFNTSGMCVEKNIRSIIKKIWINTDNELLINEIFGKYHSGKNPSNVEFLVLLYSYLKQQTNKNKYADYTFLCPISGNTCEFCREFIDDHIKKLGQK